MDLLEVQDHKFWGEVKDDLNENLIQFLHFTDEETEVQSTSLLCCARTKLVAGLGSGWGVS